MHTKVSKPTEARSFIVAGTLSRSWMDKAKLSRFYPEDERSNLGHDFPGHPDKINSPIQ